MIIFYNKSKVDSPTINGEIRRSYVLRRQYTSPLVDERVCQ